jgi:lactate racemase
MCKNRKVEFGYGKENIGVEIPEKSIISIPKINHLNGLVNDIEFLKTSLRNPIGCEPLADIAKEKKDAVIVISDRTRPMPTNRYLPIILDEINKGGIEDADISVVIALGTHRKMNDEEIKELVSENVKNRVEIKNHDWEDKSKLIVVGKRANGTDIDVNRDVYNADLVVSLGSVKPHRAAGWSGGAKIIDPGVSGEETVCQSHYSTVNFRIEDILGTLENPFRKESEEAAKSVELNFSINLILNESDEVVNIFSGDFIEAHKEAVKFAEKIYRSPQSEKADFMICGAGEWGPDFWSAVQSIFIGEYLVKNKGTIVFFARCPEGFTPEHPQLLKLGYLPLPMIFKAVEEKRITDLAAAGHSVAVSRIIVEKEIELVIVSEGISEKLSNDLGFTWKNNFQEAVDYVFKKHSTYAKGYLLPCISVTDTVIIPW